MSDLKDGLSFTIPYGPDVDGDIIAPDAFKDHSIDGPIFLNHNFSMPDGYFGEISTIKTGEGFGVSLGFRMSRTNEEIFQMLKEGKAKLVREYIGDEFFAYSIVPTKAWEMTSSEDSE